ncbi:unnamed protein product [Linum trigynum]|uniref:Uncharacterized protein n=1 Tax=Linum trigynum TaxID=586398 RepID=A0AAV2GNJ8_9ROSI
MSKTDLKHWFICDLKRGPHKDRFKRVQVSKFGRHHYWSRREFQKLICFDHFLNIATNRAWCRLLSLHEKVYYELVLEFYTTFRHADTTDWTDSEAVKCRLGGEPRSMSHHDLAIALDLGLDDDEDYVTELNSLAVVCFKALYAQLARPGQPPIQLENRLLHHMLAKSFTPAGDSASTLTRWSMYFIHSIRTANHDLHLGSVVARTLDKSDVNMGTLHQGSKRR